MEPTLDEDSLATIDLDGGQKLSLGIGVNAQEVSYLVRSSKRGNDNTDGRPKRKREHDEKKSRSGFKSNSRPEKARSVTRTTGESPRFYLATAALTRSASERRCYAY